MHLLRHPKLNDVCNLGLITCERHVAKSVYVSRQHGLVIFTFVPHFPPALGQRAAAAAQMQAVGNALAALASSGHLNREDAQELRTQTDALFGSLAQLHDLMTGPRGAELFSGSPTRDSGGKGGAANATGFTPAATSPADSPSQSVGRHTSSGAGPEAPANEEQEKGSSVRMTMQPVGPSNGGLFRVQRTPTDGGEPGQGAGSHMQLTPKHRLIAEDVAWMAGLAQSLSKSLQVESEEVELPGM